MSTTKFYKTASIAAMAVAGMTLTACASGQNGSRYGGNVYDYESGGNCGVSSACAPAVIHQPAQVVTQTYTAPAPTYSVPAQTYSAPVQCPTGTTPSNDGTCLQSSTSYSTTYSQPSYNSTTTYSEPSYSSATTYAGPIECPPGTTDAGDGTCLQSSATSHISSGATTSYNTTTSYGSGSSFESTPTTSYGSGSSYSGGAVDCPAGTIDAGDGTCLQSNTSYTGSDVTIFSGDATPSGYTSTTTTHSDVYLPIRK